MGTCYGCQHLLQGGSGENSCARFGEPDYPDSPHFLSEPPEPLYSDCYRSLDESSQRTNAVRPRLNRVLHFTPWDFRGL